MGDAAGALQAARVHEALVRQELDADPDPLVLQAVAAVRAELASASASRASTEAPPVPTQPDEDSSAVPSAPSDTVDLNPAPGARRIASGLRARLTRRRAALFALASIALVAAIAMPAAATLLGHEPEAPPVLAVGQIVDRTGDTASVARVLPELLTTSLGRFGALQVVSRPRLYELAAQHTSPLDSPMFDRAAADAGAELLVEGALYHLPSGEIRLDLRLMSLERHVIHRAYQLEGGDPFALVDSAANRIARDLGGARPSSTATPGVTVRSLAALQLYEEGLRAYYAGDGTSAERLFAAALKKDTTFAMAAYYAYKSAFGYSDRAPGYLQEALRRASWATDRERLIIRTTGAAFNFDPEQLVLAESLSTRFPADPVARVLLGNARVTSGDFDGAVLAFRQALDMNAAGLREGATVCTACDAIHGLVDAYLQADSLRSAERVARDWTLRQPSSAGAWLTLASVLATGSDSAGAAEAFRRRAALVPYAPEEWPLMISVALRAGDFDRVDRLLAGMRASENQHTRNEALWWLAIARRYEGRLDDALSAATALVRANDADASVRQLYGQVLLEMGRPREAGAVFAAVERDWRAAPAASEALHSRRVTWAMTHRATALAAAGDTAALARLIDPMRRTGARSGYGRDRRLHHYARGLLLEADGHREEAAVELRAAIFSPNFGYTRVNLELGRLYLDLGRPHEAIRVLSPALRGSIEASNLYVTHTELHALLARAFAATGAADSAAVHREYVRRALAHGNDA